MFQSADADAAKQYIFQIYFLGYLDLIGKILINWLVKVINC